MSPRFRRLFPLRLFVRTLFPSQAPQTHPDPFYLFSSPSPHAPSVPSPCNLVRALSSQVTGRSDTSRRSRTPRVPGVEPSAISHLIASIAGGSDDLESQLHLLNLTPSHALVLEVLRASNDRAVSALRFFRWVLASHPDFRPNSEAYNQMVCNLGLVDDYDSMHCMLVQLSSMGHSLTEEAFSFLSRRGTVGVKESAKRIAELLNKVGGSCRGTGIFSLIKFLCSMNAFDTAIFVMSETARRTSYYNVLIAAKCRRRDFEGARGLFDEMRRYDKVAMSFILKASILFL
ncbi:uncharacterized protein LOC122015166 [Zingiber officinale]|uniref:uncharacterized protein LOC122015166 n=1 Tax=Zingiber officinale TaxID=94328 RepID=UPI001C4C629B|nr:uncharacterized protein LOC122015166 [Zingiber officinale]